MRKFFVSAALAAATIAATAVPAAAEAQYQRSPLRQMGPSRAQVNDLLRDLGRAEAGIDRSVQRRIISRREATGLRREANQIRMRLNWALRNDGRLGHREFNSLRVQVTRLQQRLRIERHDRDGRRN